VPVGNARPVPRAKAREVNLRDGVNNGQVTTIGGQ
jgi:hypothetical protein